MAVLGLLSLTLEIPDLEVGVRFYSDAGLVAMVEGNRAHMRCKEQDRASITLIGGAARKRLHHIQLCAERLDEIALDVQRLGGRVTEAPAGFDPEGLWVLDPHGMLFHLCEHPADNELAVPSTPFEINGPGRIVRKRRSAILPQRNYAPVRPLRLGHVLVFTPDVMASVEFVTQAFGMGLADRAQDIIAFTCVRRDSDHHVIAFAKSGGVGFHHASFQVADPDEVGRGGRALLAKSRRGDWGFGRHTIGSNFFHYIQDPWGSWFEYYSDMDHIDDYVAWTPTNYGMEDSLASWGPEVPHDFVHNYELDGEPFSREVVIPTEAV
ncbi:VOC family protein [Sphingobium subterraneum]|uniref:Catechol 2,3-dioxygenase n=1 Tax=Sphingobium subterraneum TaxID=627688 RepID=A0A841IYS3_9SPHN|nr:VOC family protein [Sphingobium subterraneum]MBB6123282.1 catechol 2,3-dioxygenase [Sphingobium subterraneum]